MAKYTVKYPIGSKVSSQGVDGIITAVHIRGRGRSYEFSFPKDGVPTAINVEECEIEANSDKKIGFK